ncbi:hypothetical protein BD289DRAFT_478841 [Coniella lustricola]|uniref:Uncharacterized protein n=1 Tax=Coniella lustricola TaxID=2025994 RepID=A0A2T3ALG2_9PEZI|nr:hypothetical protein BD289DRAFT_478841 [Coniella lustricola]
MAGFVNAPNKVPEHQRNYQAAYRNHTRIWRIHPRSTVLYVPFVVLMWGTTAATTYAMGRKVLGYNTWFGKN